MGEAQSFNLIEAPRADFLSYARDAGLRAALDPERRTESQRSFASLLARSQDGALKPEERARKGAEQFVAMALVQPLLQSLRASSTAAGPFAPSQGERQFRSLIDAQVAQEVVKAARFPLVDAMARDMLKKAKSADRTVGEPTPGPATERSFVR